MTLTIEQVRDTRFHLARRNGYEPVDVDNFVDKVEATLAQLTEENDTLKAQVEALKSGAPVDSGDADGLRREVEDKDAEIAHLRSQLEARDGELETVRGEREGVVGEADGLRAELDRLRAEAEQARAEAEQLRSETEHLRGEVERRDEQIGTLSSGGDEAQFLRGELEGRDAEISRLRAELDGRDVELSTLRSQPSAAVAGATEHLVVSTAADASPAVARLLQMATEQSEQLTLEARQESDRRVSEATTTAEHLVADARSQAEQLGHEAQAHSERVRREADDAAQQTRSEADAYSEQTRSAADAYSEQTRSEADAYSQQTRTEADARAAQVDTDAAARRAELFATLEEERDAFATRVDHLRAYEGRFRESFTAQLQQHIDRLANGTIEPGDLPDLMADQRTSSPTPRLDALLGKGGNA